MDPRTVLEVQMISEYDWQTDSASMGMQWQSSIVQSNRLLLKSSTIQIWNDIIYYRLTAVHVIVESDFWDVWEVCFHAFGGVGHLTNILWLVKYCYNNC